MATPRVRSFYEGFARFFEQPTRERFREIVSKHVGEQDFCDFKEDWPAFPKVARHILALANSGGGCIIFGIREKEDGATEACGLAALRDKADVSRAIEKFLPADLAVEILDFAFEAAEYAQIVGKKFQVLFVSDHPERIPFVCRADGHEVTSGTIYVRRGTNSVEANHEEVQHLLNRRLETGHSTAKELDLQDQLGQLRLLYAEIPKGRSIAEAFGLTLRSEIGNPDYPRESFEAFIRRMIEAKKKLIEKALGLKQG